MAAGTEPTLFCLVGPTGVGKSALALALAEAVGGEIVNADSRQIYRGLDIGTAKPTAGEQRRVRHHLIDILDPDMPYSAGAFAEAARAAVADIRRRGAIPLVVGGTGLYVRALVDGIWDAPPVSAPLRQALTDMIVRHGPAETHRMLARLDPQSAAVLHPNDRHKVIRALEIAFLTGIPASAQRAAHAFPGHFTPVMVGLTRPRAELYQRIDRRVDQMLEAGWIDEVRGLMARGVRADAPAMNAVGYRELAQYLDGRMGLEEAVARIKKATRMYAKRQFTWFRKDDRVRWLEVVSVSVQALVALVGSSHKVWE